MSSITGYHGDDVSQDLLSDKISSEGVEQKQIRRARKKQKNGSKEARLRAMANPDRMLRLRMKFLDEAKRYMGVPYAKKYWKPEDPEYKSKLFLDCCGLVRRVMLNLKSDFGFHIGPWNQAYMYDTLPITVKREEDMKPGDLVFISATYCNPKMKKQKHSMTHVEIWLGDGVKTIGARWNNGKVQVFDSYRFKAKSYHSETYTFKSIDTWLKGQCRSHCPLHTWKRISKKFKPSKKSVFSLPQQQDSGQSESDKSTGDAGSQLTEEQSSGSTPDTDSATETAPSSPVEEKAEDQMPKLRVMGNSLSSLSFMSEGTSDESSLSSSISAESAEVMAEMFQKRMSVKKAEDQKSELMIEEGTSCESSVSSSVSVESSEDEKITAPKSVLKISKLGLWETGKNARNMKQRKLSKGESTNKNGKKLISSASRENMQHRIESSHERADKKALSNLAPIRRRTSPQKAVGRKAVGNLMQGSVQCRKGWTEKEVNSGGNQKIQENTERGYCNNAQDVRGRQKPAELSSEVHVVSKNTKVPTAGSSDKSRFHNSKSDNDLQSRKTPVSRRPSF